MTQVADRLAKLGLTIPDTASPLAAYVPAVRTGSLVMTSGQLPTRDGQLLATGKVGAGVSPELARDLAGQAALNAIAALGSVIDDLDKVVRVVKVVGYVASAVDFTGQPAVVNGASELLAAAFGSAGVHARSAVGVAVLPLDAPVEVEVTVEVGVMVLRLPTELVRRARELAAGGDWQVPACRPAATVVLVRDDEGAIEVLLMRRPATMAFAPGMHVFPGGRVDPESDASCPFLDAPQAGPWVLEAGLNDPEGLARAIVAAGVRETFEEAGVLLAVDGRGSFPVPDAGWPEDRVASDTRRAFPDILRRRGLRLSARLLIPFAHWVTPEVESRRYDTRFLLAAAPAGTLVTAHVTETESAVWLRPRDALAGHAEGGLPMLPPTVAVLERLAGFRTVAQAREWAAGTRTVPLMPRPVVSGSGPGSSVDWVLVNAYTGEVVGPSTEPGGSEVQGLRR